MIGLAWGVLEIAERKEQSVLRRWQRTIGIDAEAALCASLASHCPLLHMLLKSLLKWLDQRSELLACQARQI